MTEAPSGLDVQASVSLQGIAGSPGVAIGPAYVVGINASRFKRRNITDLEIQVEIDRFHNAVVVAKAHLRTLMQKARPATAEQTIMEAYVLMVGDPLLADGAIVRIKTDKKCAEWAVSSAIRELSDTLLAAEDLYLRERSQDFHFVGDMIISALRGEHDATAEVKLDRPSIVVAHDLSPADAIALVRQPVIAIVTEVGSRTSHTSIMARTLEIPAVVGVSDALSRIHLGDEIVVDGLRGRVVVWPTEGDLVLARARADDHQSSCRRLYSTRDQAACTACGVPIGLRANIELPGEAILTLDHGAQGIGLYRTEFMYVNRSEPPDEEEQYELFRTVIEAVSPLPVTLRTFDIGGDKFVSSFEVPAELNPSLGLRAVRLALTHPDLFLPHLRAMIRASAHGPVRIMIPMVTTIAEMREIRRLFNQAIDEVDRAGHARAEKIPLGAMIEVPSAALLAERFAREADFLSLGTNDLIQYTFAADRTSRSLAYLASPFDPAILRLIQVVVQACEIHNRPLSICGEMASDPFGAIMLLGLGMREFSMEASSVPEIKETLHRVFLEEAEDLIRCVMQMDTSEDVQREVTGRFAPRLFDLLASSD